MTNTCPVCMAAIQPTDSSCPQCGFKIVGSTQRIEPIVASKDAASLKATECSYASALRVVKGPQIGASYELIDDFITIGRNPQCSIFLNDMTVSRIHATLKREHDSYIISDENSFNGVWVNNQDVLTKTLRSGDFIQIGCFCLVYEENFS